MKLPANASNVIVPIRLVDSDGVLATGVAFNAPGLSAEYRKESQSSWTTITLVTATLGAYTSSGWIADSNGWYQLGLPAAALNPTSRTFVRYTYDGATSDPGQIDFTLPAVDSSGIAQASMRLLYDNEIAAETAALFFQAINDSSQDPSEVGDAFSDAFAYFFDNSSTLPPVASVTGAVGSVADISNITAAISSAESTLIAAINALNQSASRRVVLQIVPQMERPESGSTNFQIELRTYDGDGAAVNADSTPTIAATGITSGNLSGNLSAVSNPATGVYRATYNVESTDTVEQIRFEGSATISASTFTMTSFSQVCDFVAATFTTTDRANLEAAVAQTTGDSIRDEIGLSLPNLDGQLLAILGQATNSASSAAAAQLVTDKLETGIEADPDNPGDYRATEAWLANGPTGEAGVTAEEIWNNPERTLTGFPPTIELLFPQPGIGAFIPGASLEGWPKTMTVNAEAGTTSVMLARVLIATGLYVTQAAVSAATSQVIDPDADTLETPVNLTVSAIIFDTLQLSGQWSEDTIGYNLRVVIAGTRIPDARKLYKVIVTLTTTAGPIKLTWSIQT